MCVYVLPVICKLLPDALLGFAVLFGRDRNVHHTAKGLGPSPACASGKRLKILTPRRLEPAGVFIELAQQQMWLRIGRAQLRGFCQSILRVAGISTQQKFAERKPRMLLRSFRMAGGLKVGRGSKITDGLIA